MEMYDTYLRVYHFLLDCVSKMLAINNHTKNFLDFFRSEKRCCNKSIAFLGVFVPTVHLELLRELFDMYILVIL